MKKKYIFLLVTALFLITQFSEAARIKDITDVYGVRENQLIGYGLVVGLNKTGDRVYNSIFSVQTLVNMLEKMGTTVDIRKLRDLRVQNVAAVMVTATLPPFARQGMKVDVTVSSLGDAKSLKGGTLLLSPLRGPNGEVYAVAQGAISVGGAFQVKGKKTRVTRNHTTAGKIAGGALVEREVSMAFLEKSSIDLILNNADFTTALNVSKAINKFLGEEASRPLNSGTIQVKTPKAYKGKLVELIANIELLNVQVDTPAKVVLDERTGTVVIGKNVRLSEAAISHGNLTIKISEHTEIVQPTPLSGGTTEIVSNETVTKTEKEVKLLQIPNTANITDLVNALNAIGVKTRDLIAIFISLKAAGALDAELNII